MPRRAQAKIAQIEANRQMRPRAEATRLAKLNGMMSRIPAVRIPASIAPFAKFHDQLKDTFENDK